MSDTQHLRGEDVTKRSSPLNIENQTKIGPLSDDDKTADVYRYKNLIDITTALVKSCSYTYSINCSDYVIEWSLSDEAKQKYNNNIITYHQKIKEIDPSYEIPFVQPQKANESTQKNRNTFYVTFYVENSLFR